MRIVGQHVALKRRGREHVGLCPFHDDHKPSMYVVPDKQIYHCFSCGAGGNAIDFLMNFHKMEFLDALRALADEAGVALTPRRAPGAPAGAHGEHDRSGGEEPSREELLAASRFAHEFFRAILKHAEHGAEARSAIERRGVSPDMVERFELGAAPDRWDGLLKTAEARGVRPAALAATGLLKIRESGDGRYDAFRHRLMFPIHDQLGRPIAFGGRRLRDEDEPKYVNSSESALFHKSRTLFGLRHASRAIQEADLAIVVEGYTDAIALHQAGRENTVATLGTALTAEHARILQRLCSTVVLLFDTDAAGQKAADRAVEAFFAAPIDVRIATLPDVGAKDPDELLKQEEGLKVLDAAIAGAVDALEFRFARLRERSMGAGLSARANLVEEDLARLVDLGLDRVSPVRRSLVLRRLAGIAGVSESEIARAIPTRRSAGRGRTGDAPAVSITLGAAESAVGALLCDPSLWGGLGEDERTAVVEGAYAAGPIGEAARAARDLDAQGQEATVGEVLAALDDSAARQAAARAATLVREATRPEDMATLMTECVSRLLLASPKGAAGGVAERLDSLRRQRERFGGVIAVMPGARTAQRQGTPSRTTADPDGRGPRTQESPNGASPEADTDPTAAATRGALT